MGNTSHLVLVAVFLVCMVACGRATAGPGPGGELDHVHVVNGPACEVGVIFDGERPDGSIVDDEHVVSTRDLVPVGRLHGPSDPSVESNLVCVFGDRPVVVLRGDDADDQPNDEPWTSGSDTREATFKQRVVVPVTFWPVSQPRAWQQVRAYVAAAVTQHIWDKEKTGLLLSFRIGRPRNCFRLSLFGWTLILCPLHASLLDFDTSERALIQSVVGYDPDRINVYLVDRVEGQPNYGIVCWRGDNMVMLGRSTGADLLAHELGHCFYLKDVDQEAAFYDASSSYDDEQRELNVMAHLSGWRCYFTEGQIFRALVLKQSVVNGLLGARPGEPQWDLFDTGNYFMQGPAAQMLRRQLRLTKRVWPDGALGPN